MGHNCYHCVSVILSISDELDYWKTVSQRKESSKKEREAASIFCELFEDVCGEIRYDLISQDDK